MNYLKQVQQGIDHIEANLEADITPGMVARPEPFARLLI